MKKSLFTALGLALAFAVSAPDLASTSAMAATTPVHHKHLVTHHPKHHHHKPVHHKTTYQ